MKALTLRPIRFPGSRKDSLFAHYTKLSKVLAHLGFLCKTDGKGHLTPPPLDNIIGMKVVLCHTLGSLAILDRIVEASALDAASPQDPHQSCGVGFRLLSSSSVDDILVFVFTLPQSDMFLDGADIETTESDGGLPQLFQKLLHGKRTTSNTS